MGFNKKNIIMMVFVLCTILLVAACSGGSSDSNTSNNDTESNDNNPEELATDGSQKTLGIVAIDLTNPFFIQMKEAGDQAAKDYGVKTIWQSADGSVEKQISLIENFIQQGVDAILIDPSDKNAIIPVIEKAEEAGIEIITMGNKVEGDWNYNTLYPDYDNMAMLAKVFGTALDGKGQIAYLSLSKGNYVSDEREAGFIETIEKEFPNIEIVGNQPTEFDTAEAQKITETWLNNYPDLDGIAFAHDPLGIAAMSAAETMGRDGLIFGGYDGEMEMETFINDGRMLLDSMTGSYRIGYWNIAVAARIVNGAEFSKDLAMPTHYITSDETAKMLADKGLEFDYITPKDAEGVFLDYVNEFGPEVSDEMMSEK